MVIMYLLVVAVSLKHQKKVMFWIWPFSVNVRVSVNLRMFPHQKLLDRWPSIVYATGPLYHPCFTHCYPFSYKINSINKSIVLTCALDRNTEVRYCIALLLKPLWKCYCTHQIRCSRVAPVGPNHASSAANSHGSKDINRTSKLFQTSFGWTRRVFATPPRTCGRHL